MRDRGQHVTLIVVVDDSVTNRKIFTRLAGGIAGDATVTAFCDPEAMLAWLPAHSPDLVITDYKMPGMDGAEFVQRLRRLPASRDVPVVVITAYEDREFRLRALDAGATDFLQSPVDHQEFLTRSRNLLKLGQQQKLIRCRAEDLERELEAIERLHEKAIRDSRTRLVQVIDTIPAVITAADDTGARVFVNRYGAGLLPLPPGRPAPLDLNDQRVLRSGQPVLGYEETVTDPSGASRILLTSKFPLLDAQGAVRNVLTTSFDITARKQAERELHHLAHHDVLTGLGNRLLLMEVLRGHAAQLPDGEAPSAGPDAGSGGGLDAGPGKRRFALHFIDLDRFKSINDGFGHEQGDMLLKLVAARLQETLRPSDMVARLGGDEFAVVQAGAGLEDAHALANRMIARVSEPVMIERHKATIGASVGITLAPDDGQTAEQLIKNADLAMYRAKREGRGRSRFFTAEMQTAARASVLMEIDLRRAIAHDEFVMLYQPQLDAAAGRVTGAEALLRWRRPGHGLVLPQDFLPLAEDTGLIVDIDRWVLREVCRQGVAWAAQGSPIRAAANISGRTFKLEDVRRLVLDTLQDTGLDPALLELELTESTLMEHHQDIQAGLGALRRLGVQIAVDDFGTGYSSLAYLQLLPIDRLKIDGSFVRGLRGQASGAAIVGAIVGIGHSLGLEVLAEGVETAEQLDQVRLAGCDSVQGYLFSAALAADSFHLYQPEPQAHPAARSA